MNIETRLLNRLKTEQAAFATESLKRASDKTEYEYGFKVGVMNGIEHAINVLLALMEEDKKDGQQL